MYQKMVEVGEGERAAVALYPSRRGHGHRELLWHPGGEGGEDAGEGDTGEKTDMEEVDKDQGTGGHLGGLEDERVCQVQIQGGDYRVTVPRTRISCSGKACGGRGKRRVQAAESRMGWSTRGANAENRVCGNIIGFG